MCYQIMILKTQIFLAVQNKYYNVKTRVVTSANLSECIK